MMKSIYRIAWLFSVICSALIGGGMFVARFFHLTNGFQYDELYSVATATPGLGWSVIWHDMLLQDVNLPLFNLLFYGWNHIFPITHVYAHLFSALLGALAVIAAFLLAPKSWPKLKRFIFVALMSGSFILAIYGSNVRSYSLSVLLSTCFTLLALQIIEFLEKKEKPSVKLWLSFLGIGLLGAYSHYFCAALFFITALTVFFYALYYRTGRAWIFWGTAFVFFLWIWWPLYAINLMGGVSSGAEGATEWWYTTPFLVALSKMFIFLFGPEYVQVGLVWFLVIGGVSLVSTFRFKLLAQADLMLPLMQVVLLVAVLTVVGLRFNLWMDRYFLPLLPAIFVLMSSILFHLQQRHGLFILLLPALLITWMLFYWNATYFDKSEYTGLRDAFEYLSGPNGSKRVLISRAVGYSRKAMDVMFDYYTAKSGALEQIDLTRDTAPLAWESTPPVPVMVMLCSQVRMMRLVSEVGMEPKGKPIVFREDTCVFEAQPIHKKGEKK